MVVLNPVDTNLRRSLAPIETEGTRIFCISWTIGIGSVVEIFKKENKNIQVIRVPWLERGVWIETINSYFTTKATNSIGVCNRVLWKVSLAVYFIFFQIGSIGLVSIGTVKGIIFIKIIIILIRVG